MPPHFYLQAKDYSLYGVPEGTTPDAVIRATLLIDSVIGRGEGLLSSDGLTMDATGAPVRDVFETPRKGMVMLTASPVIAILTVETNLSKANVWEAVDLRGGFLPDEELGKYQLPCAVGWPSQVRVSYVAGYTYDTLPGDVKLACARLMTDDNAFEGLSSNIKKATVGDSSFERFGATKFDSEIWAMLCDYRRTFA